MHSPEQNRKKAEAMAEAEHHMKHNVVGQRSEAGPNYLLSDKGLENRMQGKEEGTTMIDQTSAGFALNNRKKARGE